MRARHIVVVVAALVMLTGCGGGTEPADGKAVAEAPAADTGIPPEPDAATAEKYIAALKQIDPEIVGDDATKVISRGRNECGTVKSHPDDEQVLVKSTNQRFTSPDKPDGFGTQKATKILAVVRQYLCPSY